MKRKFSSSWISSRQTRKQRKYRFNAPLHIRQKFMSSNLSKTLREKVGKRSEETRKGDIVRIMRGKFKKKQGKVLKVDLKNERISVEGMQAQKKDGTKVNVFFHPSKVQIIELGEGRRTKEKKVKEIKSEKKNAPEKK